MPDTSADIPKRERHVSIRFPLDVLDVMRTLAKQHERSLNGEVIWALRAYAARHTAQAEQKDEQSS